MVADRRAHDRFLRDASRPDRVRLSTTESASAGAADSAPWVDLAGGRALSEAVNVERVAIALPRPESKSGRPFGRPLAVVGSGSAQLTAAASGSTSKRPGTERYRSPVS
jgi:hypothetical protein